MICLMETFAYWFQYCHLQRWQHYIKDSRIFFFVFEKILFWMKCSEVYWSKTEQFSFFSAWIRVTNSFSSFLDGIKLNISDIFFPNSMKFSFFNRFPFKRRFHSIKRSKLLLKAAKNRIKCLKTCWRYFSYLTVY